MSDISLKCSKSSFTSVVLKSDSTILSYWALLEYLRQQIYHDMEKLLHTTNKMGFPATSFQQHKNSNLCLKSQKALHFCSCHRKVK